MDKVVSVAMSNLVTNHIKLANEWRPENPAKYSKTEKGVLSCEEIPLLRICSSTIMAE